MGVVVRGRLTVCSRKLPHLLLRFVGLIVRRRFALRRARDQYQLRQHGLLGLQARHV
jgi:hypothetical protein